MKMKAQLRMGRRPAGKRKITKVLFRAVDSTIIASAELGRNDVFHLTVRSGLVTRCADADVDVSDQRRVGEIERAADELAHDPLVFGLDMGAEPWKLTDDSSSLFE